MVKRGSAEVLHDTTEVELPGKTSSIDGDGNWTLGESLSESLWRRWSNVHEALDLGNTTLFVALSVSAGVWVGRLELDLVGLNVFESIVHKTSIATLVAKGAGAVNKLLLGEGLEVLVGHEVGSLQGTGGGEGPAGTALSLVLNWGDGTLRSPVDGGWKIFESFEMSWLVMLVMSLVVLWTLVMSMASVVSTWALVVLRFVLETEHSLVLFWSPVNHVVNTPDGIIGVLLVVLLDLDVVISEDGKSELVLLLGSVRLSVLSDVRVEFGSDGVVLTDLVEGGGKVTLVVGEGGDGAGGKDSSGSLFH